MPEERIILDPAELTEGRTEVDLTPWVAKDGIDWGDAEVEPYKSRAQIGEKIVDFSIPNREIVAPLVPQAKGGTSFATVRSTIQAVAALWQREGGILKRVTSNGGTVYADVVRDGLTLGGGWEQAHKEVDNEAEIRFEALPDFYEPEGKLTSAEEKTATELIKVISDPGGDIPARVRLVVEEKQGAAQKALIWAFRSRNYSSASTAKTVYEAEELEPLGAATKGGLSGASGGTVVSHTALPNFWTQVLGTNLGGTAFLTHTGTYRVYARLYSPSGAAVAVRLVWDVGDLVNPEENEEWRIPAGTAFYIADLGEIRLDPAPVGTHRWQAQIQAKGTSGGEDISIDRVWIKNTDEAAGVLTAPRQLSSISTLLAWDNFGEHTAGTVAGKVAPLGGTWSEAGDIDDFTVDTTNRWIRRTATSDSTLAAGQYLRLGSGSATAIDVSADLRLRVPSKINSMRRGVFARYADVNNWLLAAIEHNEEEEEGGEAKFMRLYIYQRSGGVEKLLSSSAAAVPCPDATWATVRVVVEKTGACAATLRVVDGDPMLETGGFSSDLATGGPLAGGGYGIYDAYTSASALTREYDNFQVGGESATPLTDAVLFASQKAQLTTDGMYRLDSGGSAYGPISRVIGDIPRLPPGGLENRPTELFLKASRGDLDELPDSAIDDIGVEVYASRCWLTLPGEI